MGVVLVTGGSGAGKSSVAWALAARGFRSVDGDADGRLARWVDADGAVVARQAAQTFGWMADHRWVWDAQRLDELITAAGGDTLFLCGHASNVIALFDRFTQVILLDIDVPTMRERLARLDRENDFGRIGDTGELLREWLPGMQAQLRAAGARVVDATAPLGVVVDAVLGMAGVGL
ncbi:MAG TPA: hypothetical protein VMF60_00385 [Acidimicrobiales bacterium]|nr:hypothetical protein [Acidimicrobiales bacterium]